MGAAAIVALVAQLISFGISEAPVIEALIATKKQLSGSGRADVDRETLQAIDDSIEMLQKRIDAKAQATGAPVQLGPTT